MGNQSDSSTFTVPLSLSAHAKAQQFYIQQSNAHKAKQVYLNALAVFAVDFYLRCMGFETDREASQSCDPVMSSLMNVSDLKINNRGKLECLPVLPPNSVLHIPPEVWSDRVGYVAVQFDRSLQEATLLGFIQTAPESGELLLTQLRSLEDLLEHLRHLGQSESVKPRVNLSQWFSNQFAADWRSLEALFGTNQEHLAWGLRSDSQASVRQAKLIDLGVQLGRHSVALLVAVTPEADQKMGILVQVHPVTGETHLPANLNLNLLSESGELLQDIQSRSHDHYIQLKRFRGKPGECFSIQVAFGNLKITEQFVI